MANYNINAAYDLSSFEEQRAPLKVAPSHYRKKQPRSKARQVLNFVTIVVIITLVVLKLCGDAALTERIYDVSAAQNTLNKLEDEYSYLNIELESMVSLDEIEQIAVTQLGLVKMNRYQVVYVNLQGENHVERANGSVGVFEQTRGAILNVLEWN